MSERDKADKGYFDRNQTISIENLRDELVNIQVMAEYEDYNTPLDNFDSKIHEELGCIFNQREALSEDELVFMINTSEHLKRPVDMLMFLGEYFKANIAQTIKIYNNNNKKMGNVQQFKEQSTFLLTQDILNSLGNACKMFIEKQRQELRVTIALSRHPAFNEVDGSDGKPDYGEND